LQRAAKPVRGWAKDLVEVLTGTKTSRRATDHRHLPHPRQQEVSSRIGKHVLRTTPATYRVCAGEIRAQSAVPKEQVRALTRQENPKGREVDTLMRRKPRPFGVFPH
jgi:hypothetical protein